MVHGGFQLPDYHIANNIWNEKYMRDVINGDIWLPMKKDCPVNIVINKNITGTGVADLVLKEKKERNVELNFDRLPPKKYLLILLYALNPKHRLFTIEPESEAL